MSHALAIRVLFNKARDYRALADAEIAKAAVNDLKRSVRDQEKVVDKAAAAGNDSLRAEEMKTLRYLRSQHTAAKRHPALSKVQVPGDRAAASRLIEWAEQLEDTAEALQALQSKEG